MSQNRDKEANYILQKMAKINGKKVEESYFADDEKYNDDDGKQDAKKENFMKAMKKRPLQLTILNLAYQVKILYFLEFLIRIFILVVYVVWSILYSGNQSC